VPCQSEEKGGGGGCALSTKKKEKEGWKGGGKPLTGPCIGNTERGGKNHLINLLGGRGRESSHTIGKGVLPTWGQKSRGGGVYLLTSGGGLVVASPSWGGGGGKGGGEKVDQCC